MSIFDGHGVKDMIILTAAAIYEIKFPHKFVRKSSFWQFLAFFFIFVHEM